MSFRLRLERCSKPVSADSVSHFQGFHSDREEFATRPRLLVLANPLDPSPFDEYHGDRRVLFEVSAWLYFVLQHAVGRRCVRIGVTWHISQNHLPVVN